MTNVKIIFLFVAAAYIVAVGNEIYRARGMTIRARIWTGMALIFGVITTILYQSGV